MGKSQSKPTISCERFALVGSTGSGKSAFVNAVRGIGDEDEDAATVTLVAKRPQLKAYAFPSHPHVSFCDLPGCNSPSSSDVETFWRKHELEQFDAFLIFLQSRVTQIDVEIIEKVKSTKKPLFLIRTKIDIDHGAKTGKSHVKEEVMLSEIKNYLLEKIGHLSCNEEDIFLISNYDPYKWDFFRLIEAIIYIMPNPATETTSDITGKYMADVMAHVEQNGVSGIKEYLGEKLERSRETEVRFAIAGDRETEKLAFINAIRGLEDDDDDAAKINDTSTSPTTYRHPENPKINFVDLPCIGTLKDLDFQTYDKVPLVNYDAFFIFTANHFTQHDLELAKKVKSIGKSFFLIRTKIDDACMLHEKRRPINEADVLQNIREKCVHNMKDVITNEKEIFLISNCHKDKWDFDRLIEAISEALPVHQRECFTLSLSNVTRNCLKRKAEFLKAQAFAVAAALPIPAVEDDIDVARIGGAVAVYCRQLGLNNLKSDDLESLDTKFREIIERYQPRSTTEFASPIETKKGGVEVVLKFIPVIGRAIAGSKSFAITMGYLTSALDEMEEAALAVWDNAAEKSVKKSLKTTTNLPEYLSFVKEIVTTDGGVLKIDDITLKIGAGCVVKDTEITMINHDDNEAIKSLFALGLVDAVPRVVEFLPDSLKFLKPVDLAIGFEMSTEMSTPDSQPLVLYGYYDCGYAKTVWKQVNIVVEDRRAKGIVNIRIDGFCFYSLILTKRGKLPRILSHLNHSFACRAYAFYRRLPSMDTIDIAVVILSEFVDERKEEDIKQLRDHLNKGFVEGAKGIMMRVHTDHHFEICFNFPGVKSTPLSFKVDKSELDKDGFLIDHFKRIKVKCPANGMVQISQINRSAENQLLWSLDVREKEQGTVKEKNDYVAHCKAKLTTTEISQLSRKLGVNWDELAGLMDMPYSKRDEIRLDHPQYPGTFLKAQQVFVHFNSCDHSCRHHLKKCLERFEQVDLKNTMLPVQNENVTEEVETLCQVSQLEVYQNVEDCTPLSSREMFRLSQRITTQWQPLAGLMNIAKEQRDDICLNLVYNDNRAKAEKILSIINLRENFSRKKLAECLEEMKLSMLTVPVTTGEYRKL